MGFTLIEALLASSILLGIVTAVTGAVLAGQQHAFEAQQQILAQFAAESLLAEISALDTTAEIAGWDGYSEAVGAMVDESGAPMSEMFAGLGRCVDVTSTTIALTSPDLNVNGQTVGVEMFDSTGRVLVRLERFVLEPES